MNAEIDIRDVLPSIRVPTLVLHRRGDQCLKVEEGRYLASRIPGAAFVELPGSDHLPFVGNQEEILVEIERFITRTHVRPGHERVLATVLTALPGSPEADQGSLRRLFAQEVTWHRGRVVQTPGPGLTAMFDGPARAVQCGCTFARVAAQSGSAVHAGVHIGECDVSAVDGPVLDISAAVARAARPGEVLVTRTVVDLVPGSGLQFAERGGIAIAGAPRDVPVLAAVARDTVAAGG
jgi:hypothetical protein